MGCLYQLTSPSGKSYIGITTKTAEERFELHVKHERDGRRNAIHAAIKKYGACTFKVKTLLIANDLEYLRLMERRAIKVFNTMAPHGYNLSMGGEECNFWHLEVLERMREANKRAWITGREKRLANNAIAINAMTESRKDPLIEKPRRQKIAAKMKSSGVTRGENNGHSKLTAQCVFRIRDMLACGARRILIAEYFDVNVKLICMIALGQRWGHLKYSEE
jgi:hypothetical protein